MENKEFEVDFKYNGKSLAGCEKKAFIKIPKNTGDGYGVLKLGTITRVAFNYGSSVKPAYSLTKKGSSNKATQVGGCYGVLSFATIEESTIQYLKRQIEEISGMKYNGIFRMSDLPPFDLVIIAVSENDTSGRYSKKIIRGVKIDSESSAMGSDVLSIAEEYTFKAIKVGALTASEIKSYT